MLISGPVPMHHLGVVHQTTTSTLTATSTPTRAHHHTKHTPTTTHRTKGYPIITPAPEFIAIEARVAATCTSELTKSIHCPDIHTMLWDFGHPPVLPSGCGVPFDPFPWTKTATTFATEVASQV